jgi:hypothetical protein
LGLDFCGKTPYNDGKLEPNLLSEDTMTAKHACAECRAAYDENARNADGQPVEPDEATAKVSHPHPDHPNLRVTKWVCDDHLTMLMDDYGEDVRIEAQPASRRTPSDD